MRVLIIEDDAENARYIGRGLDEAGHSSRHAGDGRDAVAIARSEQFDALVVDRMLPGLDGLSVIQQLRDDGDQTPALILSALGDVDDRVDGLKAGGDDYLVKPFAFAELMARLEALVRRADAKAVSNGVAVADLRIDTLKREVKRGDAKISLQPREFRLLEYLARHSGQIVTRTMLLENVWDYNFDPQTNVIDVHISRLRSKIDKDFDVPLIHTVRGSGYILREPDDTDT